MRTLLSKSHAEAVKMPGLVKHCCAVCNGLQHVIRDPAKVISMSKSALEETPGYRVAVKNLQDGRPSLYLGYAVIECRRPRWHPCCMKDRDFVFELQWQFWKYIQGEVRSR